MDQTLIKVVHVISFFLVRQEENRKIIQGDYSFIDNHFNGRPLDWNQIIRWFEDAVSKIWCSVLTSNIYYFLKVQINDDFQLQIQP